MKAKEVRLTHGVMLGDEGLLPVTEFLSSYTLDLLDPVGSIDSITIAPNSLGQVLDIHRQVSDEFRPGTQAYVDAVLAENIKRRCQPRLNKEQVRQLAGVDYDALTTLIDKGLTPEGNQAFRMKEGVAVERDAILRLHTMNDRELAEQRLNATKDEDVVTYNAYLAWFVTRFGSTDFNSRQVSFHSFMNITWADFQILYKALVTRDYKPLTEILEGRTEVDGKTIPFQDVPVDEDEVPEAAPKRGRGKSN